MIIKTLWTPISWVHGAYYSNRYNWVVKYVRKASNYESHAISANADDVHTCFSLPTSVSLPLSIIIKDIAADMPYYKKLVSFYHCGRTGSWATIDRMPNPRHGMIKSSV